MQAAPWSRLAFLAKPLVKRFDTSEKSSDVFFTQ